MHGDIWDGGSMVRKRFLRMVSLFLTIIMVSSSAESKILVSAEDMSDEEVKQVDSIEEQKNELEDSTQNKEELKQKERDESENTGKDETDEKEKEMAFVYAGDKYEEIIDDENINLNIKRELFGGLVAAEEPEKSEEKMEEEREWAVLVSDNYNHLAIAPSANKAKSGDTVSIVVAVDVGYRLKNITVISVDNNSISNISPVSTGDNTYKYTQPDCNVKIIASAEKDSYSVAWPSVPLGNGTVSIVDIIKGSEDSMASGITTASFGDKVIMEVAPAATYSLSSIEVTFSDGQVCNGLKNFDGKYEFTMVAANVLSIVATFSKYVALTDLTKPVIVDADNRVVPQVGDRLNAISAALPVTWEWYADGVLIDNTMSETPEIYVLTMNEVGKTIMVVAKQLQNTGDGQQPVEVEQISELTEPVIIGEGTIISQEEATSAVTYDYYNEIALIAPEYEAALDGNSLMGESQLAITDVLNLSSERVIYVRRKANVGTRASLWTSVVLPERPASPILSTVSPSNGLAYNGKIVGTTTAMEYKLASELEYQRASDSFTNAKAGTYQVRVAATNTSFAGKTAEVNVVVPYTELTDERKPVIGNITAARTLPYVGDVLKVTTTAGPGITYEWYANGSLILGVTGDTYALPPSAYNKRITVKAIQSANVDGAGHPEREISITSVAVGPVKKNPVGTLSSTDYEKYLRIDYSDETAKANSGYELNTSKGRTGFETIKLSSLIDRSTNRCFYVRQKETDYNEEGDWTKIELAARPAAPSGLSVEKTSDSDEEDGKIVGTTSAMEYKLTSVSNYQQATDGFTLVKIGSYHVRYAASENSFASKTTTVRVTPGTNKKKNDEDDENKSKAKKKVTSTKTSKKINKNTDDTKRSARIKDESGLWYEIPSETRNSLNKIMKASGGEIIDANALLYGNADGFETKQVGGKPVALILGAGAIVIEVDNPDSNVMLTNAFDVASAVFTKEQLELAEQGCVFEIMLSSANIEEKDVSEPIMSVINEGIEEYNEDYPNLLKIGFLDINLMYQIDGQGWTGITETYEPIGFVLSLPEDYMSSMDTFFILREHEGEVTLLDDEDEDLNTVTVSTRQFSTYVLMHNSTVPITNFDSEVAKTAKADAEINGNIWKLLFGAMVVLNLALVGFYVYRRKKILAEIKSYVGLDR